MIRIGHYARKSVYSDKSDSIQAQYNIGVEYCKSHYENYEIYRYEDEGFTGANVNRLGYSRLVSDVKDGKLNIVICYKIDRISRNVSDFSSFFNLLVEHNVGFVSIKEQIDTSTPLGRAMMYICSVFAQMERETIAERVKDNLNQLSKSGKWAGGRAPLGFKLERVQIDGKTHTILVENPDGLRLLNLLSDTFLENHFSLNQIEKYCRDNHITTYQGYYLSGAQIHLILRNPTYCCADQDAYDYFKDLGCVMDVERDKFDGEHGIIAYDRSQGGRKTKHVVNPPEKWHICVGLHKPLWTSQKYIAIQSRFGNNKICKTKKHKIGILAGVLRCSCGYLMRVQHKVCSPEKIYDNYFCQQRHRKGKEFCDRKFTRVEILDGAVIKILKQIRLDRSLIDNYIYEDASSIFLSVRSRSDIQKDISNAENQIANLTRALSQNSSSTAAKYIIDDIEKIDRKLSGFKYELMEVGISERNLRNAEQNKETKYKMVCEIVDNLETADYDEINRLIKELFRECVYDGQDLRIKI